MVAGASRTRLKTRTQRETPPRPDKRAILCLDHRRHQSLEDYEKYHQHAQQSSKHRRLSGTYSILRDAARKTGAKIRTLEIHQNVLQAELDAKLEHIDTHREILFELMGG